MNSTSEIRYSAYSEIVDYAMKKLDEMYLLGYEEKLQSNLREEMRKSSGRDVVSDTTVDLVGESIWIIVNDRIISNDELKWKKTDDGGLELTLKEIASQINTEEAITVWVELGNKGKIYKYNNYGDKKWYQHGLTRGYA